MLARSASRMPCTMTCFAVSAARRRRFLVLTSTSRIEPSFMRLFCSLASSREICVMGFSTSSTTSSCWNMRTVFFTGSMSTRTLALPSLSRLYALMSAASTFSSMYSFGMPLSFSIRSSASKNSAFMSLPKRPQPLPFFFVLTPWASGKFKNQKPWSAARFSRARCGIRCRPR